MRMLLVVVLWVVATVAATGLAFGAVAIVGDAATAPPAVLAPIDAPGDGPVEIVVEEGALAVECQANAITLVWAQPAGRSIISIRESGPAVVVVEFAEEDEVTAVEVRCVEGVPASTILEREADEGPVVTTSTTTPPTTPTTEADDDDDDDDRPTSTTSTTEADRPTTTTTSPSTTSTTEADDDDDDDVTTTTEADDDDPDDDDPDDDDPDDDDPDDDG